MVASDGFHRTEGAWPDRRVPSLPPGVAALEPVPDGTRVTITKDVYLEETGGPGRWIPDIPDWGTWCDAAGGRKRNPDWEGRHQDWKYPPDDPTRGPSRSRRPR